MSETTAAILEDREAQRPAPKERLEVLEVRRGTGRLRVALEGERKQVTVPFADLRGSMELLANREPEEERKLRDPILDT